MTKLEWKGKGKLLWFQVWNDDWEQRNKFSKDTRQTFTDIIYYYIFFLYFTDMIFIDLYIIVILYRNNKYCNLSGEKNMDLYNLF